MKNDVSNEQVKHILYRKTEIKIALPLKEMSSQQTEDIET